MLKKTLHITDSRTDMKASISLCIDSTKKWQSGKKKSEKILNDKTLQDLGRNKTYNHDYKYPPHQMYTYTSVNVKDFLLCFTNWMRRYLYAKLYASVLYNIEITHSRITQSDWRSREQRKYESGRESEQGEQGEG